MASLDEQFNEEEHPDEFSLLPPGDYLAQIIQSEIKPTKSGGKMAVFTFDITEGEHTGRIVWARINFVNANAQAQSIGRKELGNIARAAGVSIFDDTEELHYKPMIITLGQKIDPTGQYRPQNEIKAYKALDNESQRELAQEAPPAAVPAASQRTPQQAATATNAGGVRKPWQKAA